ncbi:MAG TPA: hypothetical protein VK007_06215 [Acidimicrobiales bacterium]|nr:hypothetical protein [Acidimicrobiales bacterium]
MRGPVPPEAGADPDGDDGRPARALVVSERGVVDLGPLHRGDRCGLGFVDDLLRLRLALARFGWSLVVVDLPEEVEELFRLVGLSPASDDQASR